MKRTRLPLDTGGLIRVSWCHAISETFLTTAMVGSVPLRLGTERKPIVDQYCHLAGLLFLPSEDNQGRLAFCIVCTVLHPEFETSGHKPDSARE